MSIIVFGPSQFFLYATAQETKHIGYLQRLVEKLNLTEIHLN